MAIALAFGRPDVDAFLDEITGEKFDEWAAYFALRPHNWEATQILGQRLSFVLAATHSRKRQRLKDHELRSGASCVHSDEIEKLRFRASAIRSQVAERIRERAAQKRLSRG